jgi:hypothetical protein
MATAPRPATVTPWDSNGLNSLRPPPLYTTRGLVTAKFGVRQYANYVERQDYLWKAYLQALGITGEQLYGDGSDGDVTIAAPTTLTRDMFYDDLTVNNATTLTVGGYKIFVKNVCTNNGTISAAGGAGGNGGNGTVSNPGAAGSAGAATVTGTIGGSGSAGGAGGLGGNNANGSAGTASAAATGDGGGGGNSGTGGAAQEGETGGNGPAAGALTIAKVRHLTPHMIRGLTINLTGTGGSGGGGGGGHESGHGGGGGGGGASGGMLWLAAREIANSGTISANGGAGGNGGTGFDAAVLGHGGGGAGGGGGGGGMVYLVYSSLTPGTITSSGGALGTGGNGFAAGANGVAGSAGIVLKFDLSSGTITTA